LLKNGLFAFSGVQTVFKAPCDFNSVRGRWMGKKKVLSEKDLRNIVYPSKNDIFGVAQKMLVFDRVMVKRQDGPTRVCRIRGKMKRRTWIREGASSSSRPGNSRAMSVARYSGGTPRTRSRSSSRKEFSR